MLWYYIATERQEEDQMEKLCNTSKRLAAFFRVLNIMLSVAAVTCLVGLCIIAAGYLFKLSPEQIGAGYENIHFGALKLTCAEGYAPDTDAVFLQLAIDMALAIVCLLLGKRCTKCICDILTPMTKGAPFHATASTNLKKLAVLSIIMGIAINCISIVSQYMAMRKFALAELLLSEKITHVTINYSFDPSFLIFTAVLFLLSYVFRYGEKLQQLSDETL
jgi:hypothetical protein